MVLSTLLLNFFKEKKSLKGEHFFFSYYCAAGSHVFKAQLSSPSSWNGCVFTPVQLIISHGKGVYETSTLEKQINLWF